MAIKLPDPGASLNLSPPPSRSQVPEGLSSLARLATTAVIGRDPGAASTALVKEVAQVQETQRQALLNRLLERLGGVKTLPESPQKTQQLARLAGEQQLLQSPQLKLLRLQVNQQSLVTYTDRPVMPGDSIKVLLKGQQLVQLAAQANRFNVALKPDSPTSAARGRDLPASASQHNQTENQSLGRSSTAQSAPTLLPEQIAKLAQALRSALPLAEKPDLSPALPLIEQLSLNQQRQMFSPNLQEALNRAAAQLRGPEQLTRPEGLRRALADSGVQLEHKLAKILDAKAQAASANDRLQALSQVFKQDWKALLLRVLQQTASDLTHLGSRPSAKLEQLPDLSQLLARAAQHTRADGQQKALQTQLLQSLYQATLHSLARVQLGQLQSLGAPQAQVEGAQPGQTLSLEIPLRMGPETLPLFIHIEQDWYQKQEEKRRSAGKVRQWQVSLSFDLPELGPFHAQVTVRGDQVGARLWAEREASSQKIQNCLSLLQERLAREGVEVTRLEVHTGAPPRRRTQIHYTLVDVTT